MSLPNPLLRDATVQEIQLELIRRSSFNSMDGEKVVASLFRHRDLWLAVLFDRPGYPDYDTPRNLLPSGLIKLRDLPDNSWNVDSLFILTKDQESASRLASIIESEDWYGEVWLAEDRKEIDRAIGSFGGGFGLVIVWWD